MESFDCTICYEKFTDTHETNCCNQCYCKKCLWDWMEKSKTCPSCRSPINRRKISKNIPIQRLVDNFPVLCPNTHLGCTAAPTKGDLSNHLAKSCDFVEVPCTLNCGFKVVKANLGHHIASECANRVIKCPACIKLYCSRRCYWHQFIQYNEDVVALSELDIAFAAAQALIP